VTFCLGPCLIHVVEWLIVHRVENLSPINRERILNELPRDIGSRYSVVVPFPVAMVIGDGDGDLLPVTWLFRRRVGVPIASPFIYTRGITGDSHVFNKYDVVWRKSSPAGK
jgi:hypothetical protein